MDEKQRKQFEELEDKAIDQVAHALISIARALVWKEKESGETVVIPQKARHIVRQNKKVYDIYIDP